MTEQLDLVAKIRDRLQEEAKQVGCDLIDFSFKPGTVGGTHMIEGVFRVQDESELDEQRQAQIQIKELEEERKRSEHDEEMRGRADEAQQDLTDLEARLRDPKKGLLDD